MLRNGGKELDSNPDFTKKRNSLGRKSDIPPTANESTVFHLANVGTVVTEAANVWR